MLSHRILYEADFHLADDKGHEKLLNEIKQVESANYRLRCLVWVNFPMAYTQASLLLNSHLDLFEYLIFVSKNLQVVLLVYMTLVVCLLIGSQYIEPLSESQCNAIWHNATVVVEKGSSDKGHEHIKHNANIIFHFAQFIFYLGWLTVAKIMLNPFGEDPGEVFVASNEAKSVAGKIWLLLHVLSTSC